MKVNLVLMILVLSLLVIPVLAQGPIVYLPLIYANSPSGRVIITEHNWWEDESSLHIVGSVRNDTDYNVFGVHFTTNLFGPDGRLIDTDNWPYIPLDNMRPGEDTCFSTYFWGAESWSRYTFEKVQWWKETFGPLRDFTVWGEYGENPYPGQYRILGFVQNDNNRVAYDVVVAVTLYNITGQVIGCSGVFVNTSRLNPGESSSFEGSVSFNPLESVGQYRLQVED